MSYRNADGSAMPDFEIAKRAKKAKQFFTNNKSAATRANAVTIPTSFTGMSASVYLAKFDMANHLKPCAYTWGDDPQAHYNVKELPVSVEYETEPMPAAPQGTQLSNGRWVTESAMENGATHAEMEDGGAMSEAEWQDYCAILRMMSQEQSHARRANRQPVAA